jgi:WD40 repeat protein
MTPDGRILAAGAGDRMFHPKGRHDKVHLWHLPSGRAAGTVTVGEPGVRSLKITPDGKRLVTVGVDGTTGIWSLPSGKLEATMPYKADLAYVEMSADGSLLAGLNPDMTAIEVRHLRSGAVATRIDLGGCGEGMSDGRFALSADNRLLAGADAVQGCVDLWHLPTGASAGRILDEPEVEYLAFAPQGALIAGVNGGVRMWRPEPALAGGSPVSEVTLAEAERLRRGKHAAADGPWLDLLVALVEWRHRNDIEVADGDALRPPRPTDIEATG